MKITDPTVRALEETSLKTLMTNIEHVDGDCIIAYCLDADGGCSDQILVLVTDLYSEVDDEFLDFKGRQYVWEVEAWSLKSIKKYSGDTPGSATIENLVDEAKYFLLNRAYLPRSE